MRDDDPVIDLDLTVEGIGADGGESPAGDEPRFTRRALLLGWLRRPWPRPLIVVVTAVVAIGGMAAIRSPEPMSPESAAEPPASPATTYFEPPSRVVPGEDGVEVIDDEFLIGGDGNWVAVEPEGELLVEASDKLGAPNVDPVFHGVGLGAMAGSISDLIPAGDYVLEIACAASLDDVSMRLNVTAGDSWDTASDIPCDGPMASIGIALTEPTVLDVFSVGPNAVHIGYSFRIIPAE